MNSLFLYPSGGNGFDRKILLQSLKSIVAITDLEVEPDEFASCLARFSFEGESNLVELKKSLDVFVLGREGKAALKLAFDIQATYPRPLNVTNEACSFEVCVADFGSFQEFEQRSIAGLNS